MPDDLKCRIILKKSANMLMEIVNVHQANVHNLLKDNKSSKIDVANEFVALCESIMSEAQWLDYKSDNLEITNPKSWSSYANSKKN